MGEGAKRRRAENRARFINDVATELANELVRARRLVTLNRLLCLAALAVGAWAVSR
jgi:hypothetical protein